MAARPTVAPERSTTAGRQAAASQTGPTLDLSIVVPVYDEEDNVDAALRRADEALEELGRAFEIIVVDDGSRDDTYPRLARARGRRTTRLKLDQAAPQLRPDGGDGGGLRPRARAT